MLAASPSPSSFIAKSPSYPTCSYRANPKASPTPSSSTPPRQPASSTSKKRDSTAANLQTASAIPPSPPPSSNKPGRRDAGTQYSPPDWPPTSSRSSLRTASTSASNSQVAPLPTPISHYSGSQQRQAGPQPETQTLAKSRSSADGSQDAAPPEPQPAIDNPPTSPNLRVPVSPTLQNALRRPLSADSNAASSASGSTNNAVDTPSSNRSNSKRPRHNNANSSQPLSVLPNDYSMCPPKTLANIIASMLMRLIAHNDSIPLRDGHLTRFHSRAPPGISVHDYLARLTFHATLVPPILLSMVFFIDRLSSYFPKFVINSLTVHRFLITAATVASKGLSDSFWTNPVYARVGGVSVKELALLELELLIQCQWKIVPRPQDLVEYYRGLVRQSDGYILEQDVTEDLQDQDLKKVKSNNSGVEMAALNAALPAQDHQQVKAGSDPPNNDTNMDSSEPNT